MTQPIIQADKKHRNRILVICLAAVLLTVGLIGWMLPWFADYLLQQEPETALSIVQVVLVIMFLSYVPAGLYLWLLGRKIIIHERFPPPGVKVIKDTKLVEGRKAKVRGQVLVALAVILILLGICGALYIPYVLDRVTSPNLRLTIE